MDTDDLSEMAWDIIVQAAQVSDTLKVELCALSGNYSNEDDWLREVRKHLQEIIEDPGGYVDYWNLEEDERITATMMKNFAMELCRRVDETLAALLTRCNSTLPIR